MWKKNRRMIKRLAVSLAAVATLAPTAQARVDENGTSVESETAYPTNVQPIDRAEQFALRQISLKHSIGQLAVRPDDRADRFTGTDSIGIVQVAIRPDDRADRFSPSDSVKYVAVGSREGRFVRTDAIGIQRHVATRPDDQALRPMLKPATDYLGRPAAVILTEGPKWDGNKPSDVVVAGDGFDWSDAGIGAGTLFGAMLLAGAAVLLARGNRKLASV